MAGQQAVENRRIDHVEQDFDVLGTVYLLARNVIEIKALYFPLCCFDNRNCRPRMNMNAANQEKRRGCVGS